MNKKFNYNFVEKTIVGSAAAIKRANKGLNPEFKELTDMLAQHPDFTVVTKIIEKKKDKKTYSKLTFDRMEEYIRTQFSDKEVLKAKLVEFEAIQKVADAKGAKYPLTKKWFLAAYPEYKENAVSEAEISEEEKALAAAAAELEALELTADDEDFDEVA